MQNQLDDIIHLQSIETNTTIGIYPHEKTSKQPVIIDLKIYTDIKKASISENIYDTCDYANLTKFIVNYLNNSKFNLIETLAETLAEILLKEFKLKKIDLKISKPLALQDICPGALVSINISRTNPEEFCPHQHISSDL